MYFTMYKTLVIANSSLANMGHIEAYYIAVNQFYGTIDTGTHQYPHV